MTDVKGESIEKQRKWYAKNVNTFSDMTMDIIYVDEEMTVVLELNFMKVAIKEKDGAMKNKDNNCIAICEKYDKATGFWTNEELETLSCVEYEKEGTSNDD